MAFLFYIDGQLTDQPVNDTELVTTIRRDSTLGALLVTQDVTLNYASINTLEPGTISGYAYLKSLLTDAICNEATVVITDQVSATETYEIYRGVIKVPNIEWDEQRGVIGSKIQDNSFYSYINNNKNIKFNLISTQTKSKEAIEPPPVYEVDMFNSISGANGSLIGSLFRGYRTYDVLKFLVPALSDNKITFESDYLRHLIDDDFNELFLFDGAALVNENTDPVMAMDFQTLFSELFKARNVSFYIDMRDPETPILRIEDINFFFNESEVFRFDSIKDLQTTLKTTKLYGTVKIGSEYTIDGANPLFYPFPEAISYFGFKQETYTPLGQCNTDNELDLVNKFIISSNAINDQIVGVVDSNLEEIFMVECTDVDDTFLTANAAKYPGFNSAPPYFYNTWLRNNKRLEIHGSNFQSAVSNTQTISGDGFRAELGTEEIIGTSQPGLITSFPAYGINVDYDPIIFVDEFSGNNYDGNGNYNNFSGVYTVPSDGDYSYTANLELSIENCQFCSGVNVQVIASPTVPAGTYLNNNVYIGVGIRVWVEAFTDGTFTTIVDSSDTVVFTYLNGTRYISCNLSAALLSGNKIRVRTEAMSVRFVPSLFTLPAIALYGIYINANCSIPQGLWMAIYAQPASYFTCNGTPSGQITLTDNNPNLYKVYQHEFKYDIGVADFQNIKNNPIGLFPFEKDGVVRNGWIEQMQHNDFTGETQVKLITSDAIIS